MDLNDALLQWQNDANKFLECTEAFAAFLATQGGIEEIAQLEVMIWRLEQMERRT